MGLSFLPLLAGCTLCCVTLPPPPPLQGKEGGRAGANFMPFSLPLFSPFFSPEAENCEEEEKEGGAKGRIFWERVVCVSAPFTVLLWDYYSIISSLGPFFRQIEEVLLLPSPSSAPKAKEKEEKERMQSRQTQKKR